MADPIKLPKGFTLDESVSLPDGFTLDEDPAGDQELSRAQLLKLQDDIEHFRQNPNIPPPPIPAPSERSIPPLITAAGSIAGGGIGAAVGTAVAPALGPFAPAAPVAGLIAGESIGALPGVALEKYLSERFPERFDPPQSFTSMMGFDTGNPFLNETIDNFTLGNIAEGVARGVKAISPKAMEKFGNLVRKRGLPQLSESVAEKFSKIRIDILKQGVAREAVEGELPRLTIGASNEFIRNVLTLITPGQMRAIVAENSFKIEKLARQFGGATEELGRRDLTKTVAKAINNSVFRKGSTDIVADNFPTGVIGEIEFVLAAEKQFQKLTRIEAIPWDKLRNFFGNKTHIFNRDTRKGLSDLLNELNEQVIQPGKGHLRSILDDLEKIIEVKGERDLTKGLTFNQIKNLRTLVTHKIPNDLFVKREGSQLIGLKKLINDEMDRFISVQPNAAELTKLASKAKNITKNKYNIYNADLEKAFADTTGNLWNDIFENAKTAQNFMRSVGRNATRKNTREALQAVRVEAFTRLLRKHENIDGLIDVTKVLKTWNNPANAGIPQIFTNSQRNSIGNLLEGTAKANLGPKASFAQNFLLFRGGVAAIQIAKSLALFGTGKAAGAFEGITGTIGTVALVVAGNKLAAKILLDPNFTKVALGLQRVRPNSKEARRLSLKLFTFFQGIKGALRVTMKNGEVKEVPFTIPDNKNRKIKVTQQPAIPDLGLFSSKPFL